MVALQATQLAPMAPQVASACALHLPAPQQPVGQEFVSQTHAPTAQRWPAPQTAPLPQAQAPLAEQLSAFVVSQAVQVAPPLPQVEVPGMLQVAPEQQPLAQLVALQLLQTPAVQVALTGQLSQVSPAVPQALAVIPDRQDEPEQQPLQDTESQMQEPPAQCSPEPQDTPVPQRHRPSAEQLSVLIGLQLTHDAPSAPHAANERVSQALPLQQPLGHDVASQTQAPDTQR